MWKLCPPPPFIKFLAMPLPALVVGEKNLTIGFGFRPPLPHFRNASAIADDSAHGSSSLKLLVKVAHLMQEIFRSCAQSSLKKVPKCKKIPHYSTTVLLYLGTTQHCKYQIENLFDRPRGPLQQVAIDLQLGSTPELDFAIKT